MTATLKLANGALFIKLLSILLLCGNLIAQDANISKPWQYVLRQPGPLWMTPTFDADKWKVAPGGFGMPDTPNSRVFTEWKTDDIWMRKTITLNELPKQPAILVHHDEDTEVYINGQEVIKLSGYVTDYKVVPLSEATKALKTGENLLAVHCHQTGGGQFIDVHLISADQVPKLPEPPPQTQPVLSTLITQWGEKVTEANAWREYPRPQLERQQWTNLNGKWDYAITQNNSKPEKWLGKILVPFAIESKLSGVQRLLLPSETLWYHRQFELDAAPRDRLLLHFEAVDYQCQVTVNGKVMGQHTGGNDPFSFDITDACRAGTNELEVRVEDATGGTQLKGKQRLSPEGIWYTRVSGIWQTVWLEQVNARSLEDLKIATDAKAAEITVTPKLRGPATTKTTLKVEAIDGDRVAAKGEAVGGESMKLKIDNAKLWSPNSPHLYKLRITLTDESGKVLDEVNSYTGIRSVGKTRDANGHWRFTLNEETIFHWGPLDQGWWPDGLLTPPAEDAMKFEIQYLKDAGFNMIRKHIKVEPRRYYYHCDRLGMMVWQDQVSADKNPKWTRFEVNPEEADWTTQEHQQFLHEFDRMITTLDHFPCIVVWTPFNEAWGQHLTMETGKWAVKRDPSRLINIASGGNFWPVGDIADWHQYPHPSFPFDQRRFENFIQVVGEFGGHGWPVEEHLWDSSRRNWGYGGLPKTIDEYKDRYRESIRLLIELKSKGIAAGVYTQTTDVEGEINGLLTYDRKVQKLSPKELREISAKLLP